MFGMNAALTIKKYKGDNMKPFSIAILVLSFSIISFAGEQCWKNSHCATGNFCDIPPGEKFGICVANTHSEGDFCTSGSDCRGLYTYCIAHISNTSYGECTKMGPSYKPCYVGDTHCGSSTPALP